MPARHHPTSHETASVTWLRPGRAGFAVLCAVLAGDAIVVALCALHRETPLIWPTLALVMTLAWVAAGVIWARLGVFARPIVAFAGPQPWLALTFDDGPHPVETPAILGILAERGHQATFFVIGTKAAAHPALVRTIVAAGHTVANHTLYHAPWTALLPAGPLARQIVAASTQIVQAGAPPTRWMRAPVGLISPPVARAAQIGRVELVHWTVTARDGVADVSALRCLQRLKRGVRPGAILVLHDGVVSPSPVDGPRSVARQVLPALLDELDRHGLVSVSLDQLAAAAAASAP